MAFKVLEVDGWGGAGDGFSEVAEQVVSQFAHSRPCFEVGDDEELVGDMFIFD